MIGSMTRSQLRSTAALGLAGLVLGLAACGTSDGAGGGAPPPSGSTAMPESVPAAEGVVTTDGLVTVLDEGRAEGGPRLCLGPVARSLPPQCEGVALAGWSWSEHSEHQRRAGVRWGDFALTGTFDGSTFTVTEAVPAAVYDEPPGEETDLETPCPEPADGWKVVDAAKVSSAALDETLRVAGQLPGYADSWLDPAPAAEADLGIVNVRVVQDVAGAEATLRETWGGALCVSQAAYSAAELTELSNTLQRLPGVLTSWAWLDVVRLVVVHDDGSLQDWADQTYGEGRVEVRSTLAPAEG